MSSWIWVTNTLKNLRIGGTNSSLSPVPQSRSPPLFGAQTAAVAVPPKPKKPLTPYFRFLGQVREDVKKENPSLKPTELMKKIAERWDKLDEPSKSRYSTLYRQDMESYSVILQKYNQALSPEQREIQQELKMDKQIRKDKRDKRKRLRELGRPKKPATAFISFLKTKVPPGSSIADHQTAAKEWGAKWKAMSEAEKAPYVTKYQQDFQDYDKILSKWEEKMMKQGNQDVVRQSMIVKSQKAKSK